jgi:hypothetical protein
MKANEQHIEFDPKELYGVSLKIPHRADADGSNIINIAVTFLKKVVPDEYEDNIRIRLFGPTLHGWKAYYRLTAQYVPKYHGFIGTDGRWKKTEYWYEWVRTSKEIRKLRRAQMETFEELQERIFKMGEEKYEIIFAKTINELAIGVNEAINNFGYEPIGAPFPYKGDMANWCQAIFKRS